MTNMSENNSGCKIEKTNRGLEISGDCAQGLVEVFTSMYNISKKRKSEIFACACVNREIGRVEKVIIGNIGSSTTVSTNGIGRVCPENSLQISCHTHPVSGKAKFSAADGKVIVDRFNKEYDDGHCVVGENNERCIFQTRLREVQ